MFVPRFVTCFQPPPPPRPFSSHSKNTMVFSGGTGVRFHHKLKYPEITCRAMSNLHARSAFSSSSETKTANLQLAQNRIW